MTRLEPGLEFLPHLTLLRPLARGGMGYVWVARDTARGEEVVAKILPAGAPDERVALLRREARLVRKLTHPGIVPVYGFESGPHGSAVLLRHMTGGDAGTLRGAPPPRIVRLGREVAEALDHLHGRGVVHRDVKPTNVLLDESGRAHLADFGIAAVASPVDDEGLILHGGGSRGSMSPQQRAGETAAPADDVYSLGALLYELVSGRPPFSAEATDDELRTVPPPHLEGVPPADLGTLIASMLAKEPGERPRDMRAVLDALREIEGASEVRTLGGAGRVPAADVHLQPPPRVTDVGVVAPPPLRPAPATVSARGPSQPSSLPRVLLLGSLALAVVFVLFVLPRWAQKPTPSASSTPDPPPEAPAEASASSSPPDVADAPATPFTPPPPEAPPAPTEAPPPAPTVRAEAAPPRPRTPSPPDPAAVQAARRAEEFQGAMSAAQSAFARGDWPAAKQALGRAAALEPGSPAVVDAQRRVEEGERTALLAHQRQVARQAEGQEDWRRALVEYDAALKLDPAVAFALEGRKRASARASLAERLDFHIAHPLRLATDAVAHEAEGVLQQAREIGAPGPRHQRQVADLEQALAQIRRPVPVAFESDGATEVVVHKVGRLGAFSQKVLELRPGTYTVVGKRRGYRDVRRQVVVEPGGPPPPVVVRCEEEI